MHQYMYASVHACIYSIAANRRIQVESQQWYIENETMPDYIAKSIQDQQNILDSFQAAIDSADADSGQGHPYYDGGTARL